MRCEPIRTDDGTMIVYERGYLLKEFTLEDMEEVGRCTRISRKGALIYGRSVSWRALNGWILPLRG